MRSIIYHRSFSVFIAFTAVLVLFALLCPGYYFTTWENIKIILVMVSEFCIVVLGVGLLMISGEFDLSISATLLFCSLIFLRLSQTELNLFLSTLIVLGVGLFIGLVNGVITIKGRIPSFITTLGTMMLWIGITNIFSPPGAERSIVISVPLFSTIFTGKVAGVPVQFLWFILIALILGIVLHFHKLGCWVYATGGNKEAARAMGIKTDLVKTICFMLVGLLCALSAIMQTIYAGTFFVGIGTGWNLMAIAGSVIGGASLFGGRGNMPGIVLGGLMISVIENGLTMLGISYFWAWAVYGSLILSFILFYMYLEKRLVVVGRR